MSLFGNTFFPHPFPEVFLFISGVYFSTFSLLSTASHFHTHSSASFIFSPCLSLSLSLSLSICPGGSGYLQCVWTPCFQEISCQSKYCLCPTQHIMDGERKQDGEKHKKVWLWYSQRCHRETED